MGIIFFSIWLMVFALDARGCWFKSRLMLIRSCWIISFLFMLKLLVAISGSSSVSF